MNILFITDKNVNPILGGIERITYVLADGFQRLYGHRCFSAFTQRVDDTPSFFAEELLLTKGNERVELNDFVKKNSIDIIIAQGFAKNVNSIIYKIRESIADVPSCKLLFVFHNMPGFEYVRIDPKVLLYRITHLQNLKMNLSYLGLQLFSPFIKPLLKSHLKSKYWPPYDVSDKVILLTEAFIPQYAKCADVQPDEHFAAIGNAASFDQKLDPALYDGVKKKEVLCVARFDDRDKRVSLVLRIWAIIEKAQRFSDWKLRIVGYGEDEGYYRRLTKKLNLQNVSFEGKKDPFEYYRTASLFMMTSAHEGFGIVLLEAQQMGAVPIAFDSFATVHDIITDGVNGFLVQDGDIQAYASKMQTLMDDAGMRKQMAEAGIQMLDRFSVENITQKWNDLFESLK